MGDDRKRTWLVKLFKRLYINVILRCNILTFIWWITRKLQNIKFLTSYVRMRGTDDKWGFEVIAAKIFVIISNGHCIIVLLNHNKVFEQASKDWIPSYLIRRFTLIHFPTFIFNFIWCSFSKLSKIKGTKNIVCNM